MASACVPATGAGGPSSPAEEFLEACIEDNVDAVRRSLEAKRGAAWVITAEDVSAAVERVVQQVHVEALSPLLRLGDARAISVTHRMALARTAVLHGRSRATMYLMHAAPPGGGLSRDDMWSLYMDASAWGHAPVLNMCEVYRPITHGEDAHVERCALEAARARHPDVIGFWLRCVRRMQASDDAARRTLGARIAARIFHEACKGGCIYMLDEFQMHPVEIGEGPDDLDRGFAYACEYGHLETSDYVLDCLLWTASTHYVAENVTDGVSEPLDDPLTLEPRDDASLPLDEQRRATRRIPEYAFAMACHNGHVPVAMNLLRKFPPNRVRMPEVGVEALIRASDRGHAGIVRLLLALDGDDFVDADARQGAALDRACAGGHLEVVRALCEAIDAGRTPRVDVNGREGAPLQWAVQGKHLHVVQYLLALKGGEAVHADARDNAALKIACSDGDLDIVRVLLDRVLGDVRDQVHVASFLPHVYQACDYGHDAVVELLLTCLCLTPQHASTVIVECMWGVCCEGHASVAALLMDLEYVPTQDVADAIFDSFKLAHKNGDSETAGEMLGAVRELQRGAFATQAPEIVQAIAAYDDDDSDDSDGDDGTESVDF